LTKDHQNSLSSLQTSVDEERETTRKTHESEVDALKADVTKVTNELTEKLTSSETEMKALIETHQTALTALTTEKEKLITDAETAKLEQEKKYDEETQSLKDAIEKVQTAMTVCHCN
jgi:hypothetical protein